MEVRLDGKRAVVCGSTQGIGRAIAEEFAKSGAAVTLVARNEEKLREVRDSLVEVEEPHEVVVADFTQPIDLREKITAIAAREPRHILVNNTGGPAAGPAHEANPEAYVAAFEQHIVCNQILVQALLGGMQAAKYGRILNIISTSVYEPIPNLGVSNTIRGATASWAKTLSKELGPFGITVNNILPGYTNTGRLEKIISGRAQKSGQSEDDVSKTLAASVPAGRFAEPDELAYAATFLASPLASYISGVSLAVDGGRLSSI